MSYDDFADELVVLRIRQVPGHFGVGDHIAEMVVPDVDGLRVDYVCFPLAVCDTVSDGT